jgi:hypothetical protein
MAAREPAVLACAWIKGPAWSWLRELETLPCNVCGLGGGLGSIPDSVEPLGSARFGLCPRICVGRMESFLSVLPGAREVASKGLPLTVASGLAHVWSAE